MQQLPGGKCSAGLEKEKKRLHFLALLSEAADVSQATLVACARRLTQQLHSGNCDVDIEKDS